MSQAILLKAPEIFNEEIPLGHFFCYTWHVTTFGGGVPQSSHGGHLWYCNAQYICIIFFKKKALKLTIIFPLSIH
jgi:hypothetical protein